ncbi:MULTISPECIES: DUF2059 domain-containing protein [unclassified Sphingobium]|uniref:DUF2059 domain-containing protein n=1 Tax=unclassified Sphingobium TaxID=2611147 RepID=UPI002225AF10|nr:MULTISPECIES: DUF2059 domain-containing protein [unclassified Sphingobium]MCW2413167.1 hypothetical protein [Sphingobium sp. B8D3D]
MRLPSLLLAGACALLPLAPAWAADETVAQATSIDPARRAAAEAFALSVDLKGQLASANEIAAGQMESSILRQLLESNPKAQEAREKDPERFERIMTGLQSALALEVRRLNAELEPSVYSETLDIYARTFTESELREIQGFYASPLGQKLLAKQPELMRECIAMSQRLMIEKMPTLFVRLKETIEANGLDFKDAGKD